MVQVLGIVGQRPAMGFGKYRGRLLKDIAKLDADYLNEKKVTLKSFWIKNRNFGMRSLGR